MDSIDISGPLPLPASTPDLSDVDILAQLQEYRPVTSERNVWAFWDKGLANSPAWNQRNVIGWVRRLGSSWTVRVVDHVTGSPTNVSNYVESSFFPQAFNDKTMTGPHVGPHAGDLVRLPLLYLHGGVWLDIGFLLFRSLEHICWNLLEDPSTSFEMGGFRALVNEKMGLFFNGFIAARKGNLCIKYWHETYLHIWQGITDTIGVHDDLFFQHLPTYQPASDAPLNFDYPKFVDYIVHIFCLERIRHLKDPVLNWDGPEYFASNVYLLNVANEVYMAQELTRWDGRKQYDLLSISRDGPHDERWQEAEAFVRGTLTNSSAMKLSHGIALPSGQEFLATIWDNHPDADIARGTFAEYLRWASENYVDKRELTRVTLPTCESAILVGGMFEVVGKKPSEVESEEFLPIEADSP
ncbi:MAG: hypothetical protein MMC33_008953 [Icmadophila ericetorum]|nr:hypothetical protein [Icmadophila ericetorum]